MFKNILKILIFIFIVSLPLFAEDNLEKKIDCIILEDENSIICKYLHERIDTKKMVIFNWIEPNGNTTRVRSMIIPPGHGSVYDFRYIGGRSKGLWTLKVVDQDKSYKTTFEIE